MTSRITRVENAIRRHPGAPVAKGELTLDPVFARKFLEWKEGGVGRDVLSDTALVGECCRLLNLDLVCMPPQDAPADETAVSDRAAAVSRFAQQGIFVFQMVNGAFQQAMQRRDMMSFLKRTASAPDAVAQELRMLSEGVIAAVRGGVGQGARGIIVCDDIAYQQSTYVSPAFIERHLLPLWRRQTAAAVDLGVPVFLHSDGNLRGVLPLIAAAGFDGLQCIESSAGMDLGNIKEAYGENLCLMGSIDPALLVAPEDPQEAEARLGTLRRDVAHVMETAAGGGIILGTCSGLHAGMSPELVDWMYRLASALEKGDRETAS